MVDLTNCTFDGHIYNTRRVMEECLAIKPDLIFLWDEAWFGFARWSPFLRPRTAMGAAADIEAWLRDPASVDGLRTASAPSSATIHRMLRCWMRAWCPIRARCACASTRPTRRTSRCRRCGRDRWSLVKDVDYHKVEEQFHEAVFTHASTSPNQQIDREPGCRPAPDGAGGLRAGDERDRDRAGDPPRGQPTPADLEVFPRARRRRDDPGRVPAERLRGLPRAGRQLGDVRCAACRTTSSASIRRA